MLITGESGTGKTLLARAIHRLSGRVGPMVEADSTVFAESVLDVELFGHERGAFSGAVARKAGLIELASNGTLFIDEVGVLSAKLQSKLARALEHGSFFRVGGTQKVDIAVRLVTSSNHDLEAAVRDGRFRDDLLYRLNTVTVSLPPLRERAVDIPLLAQHFLTHIAGASAPVLTPDAIALMQEYSWPGNIRELRNVIERVVLLSRGDGDREIRAQDLPLSSSPASARLAVGAAIDARGAGAPAHRRGADADATGTRATLPRSSASRPRRCIERSASTDFERPRSGATRSTPRSPNAKRNPGPAARALRDSL